MIKPFESAAVKRKREAAVAAATGTPVPAQETPAQATKIELPTYQPSATKYQKPCGFLEREEKLNNNDFQWSTAKLVGGIDHEECSMEQRAARCCFSYALSDAVKGNVPVTAEHYDNIPYYQSPLGKAIPSSFLTPAKSPYQTDIICTQGPGCTVVEEAAYSAHVAAAAPECLCCCCSCYCC